MGLTVEHCTASSSQHWQLRTDEFDRDADHSRQCFLASSMHICIQIYIGGNALEGLLTGDAGWIFRRTCFELLCAGGHEV